MKHVMSFIFWTILSVLFVGSAYKMNISSIQTVDVNEQVLAQSVTTTKNTTEVQSLNSTLTSIAITRANDMVENDYYAHQSPSGSYFFDYFESAGINSNTPSCENLLLMPSGMTREEVDEQWRNSPAHNDCLNADHNSYGYTEAVFDKDLGLSVYVYIAATL